MTPAQRIGQLLMIGVPVDEPASALESLGDTPIGGVFLEGRSAVGADEIKAGVEQLQGAESVVSGAALHVSVDQEGGQVQSLQFPDFPAIPDAVAQGQQDDSELAAGTTAWAGLVAAAGVTLDLAPVADVVPAGTEDENPPIGKFDRQYGSTPDSVARAIAVVVPSMRAAGLGATVKHFPGLGRVTVNTDTSTDAVDDHTSATSPSLEPFRTAIEQGATAVMMSSALYPKLDAKNIAAFSSFIIGHLLRKQLKFDGLVVSDDMGNAVAVSQYSPGTRAVKFITAGGDMVLSVNIGDLEPMTTALTAAFDSDPEFAIRVNDAALHVLRSKKLTC